MNNSTATKPISVEDAPGSVDPAEKLRQLWKTGNAPKLAEFLSQLEPLTPEQLVEVLHVDQRERWQAGEPILAEHYLQTYSNVADNVETALDLIYSEFRFREDLGEEPRVDDYLRRFPQYRTVLEQQFKFYHAIANRPESGAKQKPERFGAAIDVSRRAPRNTPTIGLVQGSASQSTGEITILLRRRLRFLALVGFISSVVVVAFVVEWRRAGGFLPPANSLTLVVSLLNSAFVAAAAAILWTRRNLSLRQLRILELILFGSGFAFWSWDHAFIYPELRLLEPPFWFGMIMGVAVSGPWDFMIIAYGIFIPNTWRRCAAVVGVMALAPIVISVTTSIAADASGGQSPLVYLLTLATYTGGAAALATYGAHRIEVLRQEALAARRFGQYQLKERLGAGGMGEVYLAEHVLLKRPCAIKLIRPERAADRNSLLRFEREVQVTATLTHPNTVEILDYGHADDGTFYYVMEHLPGLTLEELISRYGPLPPERVVHLLRQVCGALEEAHAIGLIHRDIKPGNILVCERGGHRDVAKLLDFGLAQVHGLDKADHKLTQEGAIAGTPAYMSPEQAAGKSDLDIRSDIYSLGAVAYFLLTGKPPFVRQTAMQILAAHIYESPARIDTKAGVPADLEAVVRRCLEKDRAQRFLDAESLEQALARCSCADRWTREQASAWWLDRRV
jgi:serine/threonine-protein kinase